MACELMEYRDPRGRAPVAYSRIMSQMNLSRETVEAAASRFGVTIPEEHFACEKKRGRPKVEKKRSVQAETVEDLLSRMVISEDDEARSEAETVVMSENDETEESQGGEAAGEAAAAEAAIASATLSKRDDSR